MSDFSKNKHLFSLIGLLFLLSFPIESYTHGADLADNDTQLECHLCKIDFKESVTLSIPQFIYFLSEYSVIHPELGDSYASPRQLSIRAPPKLS